MSIASLPMYDLPEAATATEALWRGLARHFAEAGIEDVPAEILRRPTLARALAGTRSPVQPDLRLSLPQRHQGPGADPRHALL